MARRARPAEQETGGWDSRSRSSAAAARTRRSSSRASRAARRVLPIDELVLLDPAAERLAVVAGLARRMLARAGSTDPGHRDRRPGRGRRWRRVRAGPAARRRPGRPDAGRDAAAALRLRGPGDHRAGWLRQGAPDRAGRARARRPRRSTSRSGRLAGRLHQSRGHRDPGPARPGSSGHRPVQRGHQLPAWAGGAPGRRARAGVPRPRRPQPPDLDPCRGRRRGRPPPAPAGRRAWRTSTTSCPSSSCAPSAPSPPTTCATTTPTGRSSPRSVSRPSRAEDVMAIERQLLDLYRDPTLDTSPELLRQRGGAYYSEAAAQLITSLHAGTRRRPGGRCPQPGRHPGPARRRGRGAAGAHQP